MSEKHCVCAARACAWLLQIAKSLAAPGLAVASIAGAPAIDEIAWLKSPSELMPLGLGSAVACSGDGHIAVAGGVDPDLGIDAAAVTVWRCTPHGASLADIVWHPTEDARAHFGGALAFDATGGLLLVGAPHEMGPRAHSQGGWPGGFQAGSVHVLRRTLPGDPTTHRGGWEEIALLRSKESRSGATFGAAVAIDGSRILVGSPGHSGSGFAAGFAEVFVAAPDGWRHEAALNPSGVASPMGSRVGSSVALAGRTAAVGAPGHASSGPSTGCVDIHWRGKNGWTHTSRITSPHAQGGGMFGTSLALDESGVVLAVGAPCETTPGRTESVERGGQVHIFRCVDEETLAERWELVASIPAPRRECSVNEARPEAFGMSLAIRDGVLAIGASEACVRGESSDGDHAALGAGAAYVALIASDGVVGELMRATSSHAAPEHHDGYRVALGSIGAGTSGSATAVLLVGRLGNSDLPPGPGGATLFALPHALPSTITHAISPTQEALAARP
jgi:hypothetical protein